MAQKGQEFLELWLFTVLALPFTVQNRHSLIHDGFTLLHCLCECSSLNPFLQYLILQFVAHMFREGTKILLRLFESLFLFITNHIPSTSDHRIDDCRLVSGY